MLLHPTKTKEILVSFLNNPPALPPVVINSHIVEQVNSAKLLGVTISRDLKWQERISNIVHKASSRLYFITILKRCSAKPEHLLHVYRSHVSSILEYACPVWHPGRTREQSRFKIQMVYSASNNEKLQIYKTW